MAKYLFKANIFAKLSEIVEADSEKEVWDKIRNRKSFEINQEVLNLYPSSIEIRKIKEKKDKNNTELKEFWANPMLFLKAEVHQMLGHQKMHSMDMNL